MRKPISPARAAVEGRVLSMLSPDLSRRQGPPPRQEELVAEGLLEQAELLLSRIAGDGTSPEEARLFAQAERLIERAQQIDDEPAAISGRKPDAHQVDNLCVGLRIPIARARMGAEEPPMSRAM